MKGGGRSLQDTPILGLFRPTRPRQNIYLACEEQGVEHGHKRGSRRRGAGAPTHEKEQGEEEMGMATREEQVKEAGVGQEEDEFSSCCESSGPIHHLCAAGCRFSG